MAIYTAKTLYSVVVVCIVHNVLHRALHGCRIRRNTIFASRQYFPYYNILCIGLAHVTIGRAAYDSWARAHSYTQQKQQQQQQPLEQARDKQRWPRAVKPYIYIYMNQQMAGLIREQKVCAYIYTRLNRVERSMLKAGPNTIKVSTTDRARVIIYSMVWSWLGSRTANVHTQAWHTHTHTHKYDRAQ